VKAVDEKGDALSAAWVRVTTQYGVEDYRSVYEQTNASGFATFDNIYSITPSAQVRVYWRGVEAANQMVNLSYEVNNVIITCGVFELSVLTLDGNGSPLRGGASVELIWIGDMPYTSESSTDGQGVAVFPQMPYHSYQVFAYWQSKQVHEGTFDFTNLTTSYVADCDVYDLIVNVADKEDRPISKADVTVTRSDNWKTSKKTDNGIATFIQLATESYSIEASYLSSSNTTTINLVEDTEISLKLNVSVPRTFEITVEVMWSDGKPVFDANVVVRGNNGQTLKSGVTDANGVFTASLIEGVYTIEVSRRTLKDVKNVTIDSQTTIPFLFTASLRTYTLTVTVTDHDGSLVDGALVEVNLNGATISSSETTGGGASFDLKEGAYKIVVTWNDNQKEKTVDFTEDTELSITFQRRSSFDLLFYILAVITLATICLVVLYLRRRHQRMITFPYIPPQAEKS
jgi:hypothetical protein